MSICIISDHVIMLRQNNTQHIDQVKPKSEGGFSPQSPSPGSAPGWSNIYLTMLTIKLAYI